MQTYGVSGDDAFAAGLTCGGILDLYIEPVSPETFPELPELMASLAAAEPVALATTVAVSDDVPRTPRAPGARLVLWPDRSRGTLGAEPLDRAVAVDARGMLDQGATGLRRYGPAGQRRGDEISVFIQSFAPAPRMLVFGAIDFAAAFARLGAFLGFRVTVCDARPVFATAARFPDAHEVVVRWPHEYLAEEAAAGRVDGRTVIAVLTHDPKFDVPLLATALRLPRLAYIGALGSRRTHLDRLTRLREVGLNERELARLCSPAGLDLGGRTPQETAVSIAAEFIAGRWGGTGDRLTLTDGPIHIPTPEERVSAPARLQR